jgi:hypothetical protein
MQLVHYLRYFDSLAYRFYIFNHSSSGFQWRPRYLIQKLFHGVEIAQLAPLHPGTEREQVAM